MLKPSASRKRLGNWFFVLLAVLWSVSYAQAWRANARHLARIEAQTEVQRALESLLSSGNIPYAILNERGLIIGYNPGMERIFGYTKEEVLGKDLSQLMAPEDFSKHRTSLAAKVKAIKSAKGKVRRRLLEDFPLIPCQGTPKGKPPIDLIVAVRAVVDPMDGQVFLHAFVSKPEWRQEIPSHPAAG